MNNEVWNCPECGRVGNTGNYCGGCGTQRPILTPTPTPSTEPTPIPTPVPEHNEYRVYNKNGYDVYRDGVLAERQYIDRPYYETFDKDGNKTTYNAGGIIQKTEYSNGT